MSSLHPNHRILQSIGIIRARCLIHAGPLLQREPEIQDCGDWFDIQGENAAGADCLGKRHFAFWLGPDDGRKPRLQHRDSAIPWPPGVWARYGCLHNTYINICGDTLLPNHLRKGGGATEFSGGERSRLSWISSKRMGMWDPCGASIATVPKIDCKLSESAGVYARRPPRCRGSVLRSVGMQARLHSGHLRIS